MNLGFEEEEDKTANTEGAWKRFSEESKAVANRRPQLNKKYPRERVQSVIILLVGGTIAGVMLARGWTRPSSPVVSGQIPANSVAFKNIDSITRTVPPVLKTNVSATVAEASGLKFAPAFDGYVRVLPTSPNARHRGPESIVSDPSVKPAPPGYTIRIIRPDAIESEGAVKGPFGKPTVANRQKLIDCIQTLARYEESKAEVATNIKTVPYDRAPWIDVEVGYQGRSTFPGWHNIEIENDLGRYRFLIPDHRYADNEEAYKRLMDLRLSNTLDQKIFPDARPAGAEKNAINLSKEFPSLPGVSIVANHHDISFFSQGPKVELGKLPKDLGPSLEAFQSSFLSVVRRVTEEPRFKNLDKTAADKTIFSLRVVYPMGERQYYMSLTNMRRYGEVPLAPWLKVQLNEYVYWAGYSISGYRKGVRHFAKYEQTSDAFDHYPLRTDEDALRPYR